MFLVFKKYFLCRFCSRYAAGELTQTAWKGIASLPLPEVLVIKPKPPQLAKVSGPFTALISTYIDLRNQQLITRHPELAHPQLPKGQEFFSELSFHFSVFLSSVAVATTTSALFIATPDLDLNYEYIPNEEIEQIPHKVTFDEVHFDFPEEQPEDGTTPTTRIRKVTVEELQRQKEKPRLLMHDEVKKNIVERAEQPEMYQKWFDQFEPKAKPSETESLRQRENLQLEPSPPPKEQEYISKRPTLRVDRIKIPAKDKKEGAIYRYKESFYDNTGVFLYKVPGIEPIEERMRQAALKKKE